MEDNSSLRTFAAVALTCGIAYVISGPVGLAVVALIALLKTAKKEES